MNIQNQTADILTLVLEPKEAQYLLEGLHDRLDLLGESAQKLSKLLMEAGVHAPDQPDHIRTEYMPPL